MRMNRIGSVSAALITVPDDELAVLSSQLAFSVLFRDAYSPRPRKGFRRVARPSNSMYALWNAKPGMGYELSAGL